jgi:hypothetical protein
VLLEMKANWPLRLAALDALRSQLHNLEETIAELLELMKSIPETNPATGFSIKSAAWIRSRML